jgi:hypothetical protein
MSAPVRSTALALALLLGTGAAAEAGNGNPGKRRILVSTKSKKERDKVRLEHVKEVLADRVARRTEKDKAAEADAERRTKRDAIVERIVSRTREPEPTPTIGPGKTGILRRFLAWFGS